MLSPEQVRAARALLKIDQGALAERAGVSVETVKRFERSDGQSRAQESTVANIGAALEKSGIVFIGENEKSIAGGVGVRFAEKVDADEWNRKVSDVISSIPEALRSGDYDEVAAVYAKVIEGRRVVEVDEIQALVAELLDIAENRLYRRAHPDGGLLDLMIPHEDE